MNKVKCLIYCTKAKPYLNCDFGIDTHEDYTGYWHIYTANSLKECSKAVNGKIVAQFDCEKVERFDVPYPVYFWEVKDKLEHITNNSCLSLMSLHHYLKNDSGYAIHISNLEIFDNPKELAKHTLDNNSDFYVKKWIKKFDSFKGSALTKAPQNMCNVYDVQGNHYVLISIRPEWVCKILNGEKTIEVRKQVLNCLKELI